MTVAEAAKKWGITPRRIQELIRGGRISGIYKIGTTWVMPDDTQKPIDLRFLTKSQREKEKKMIIALKKKID